ncbi:ankyrin repeat domain-containing protein [Flagellimonas zhangzhouensis]|uniref:Ankyrin repeat-containing protein n=1 Tax=Flagellimonas zhangzhouensis TaxID=1073328 RepID=A0A1H2SIF6_9FLAO|nr:ankyrin repeat domain-containing protein [Allomuricauda zhangzhouensis]SDQ75138.1 Ankyrin repeat-containing protein [Allomuricauda zhangzhouensis]SDW31307.1 Ankyrin repeat-containing protein [Allomuricauda zhangzhouensis]
MRNFKINSVKQVKYVLFILAVSLSACGQQKANPKAENTTKTEVKAPDVALQAAVVTGNFDAVKQHIAAGTDINQKDALSGSTPLITAITFEKNDIAKALVDAGADLSIKNSDGSTALHVAAFFCRVESVQMLMDAGADKTTKNNYGATPRETVVGSFTDIKPIYEMMQQQLGPIGLQLDLEEVEKTRPVIAMILQ